MYYFFEYNMKLLIKKQKNKIVQLFMMLIFALLYGFLLFSNNALTNLNFFILFTLIYFISLFIVIQFASLIKLIKLLKLYKRDPKKVENYLRKIVTKLEHSILPVNIRLYKHYLTIYHNIHDKQ